MKEVNWMDKSIFVSIIFMFIGICILSSCIVIAFRWGITDFVVFEEHGSWEMIFNVGIWMMLSLFASDLISDNLNKLKKKTKQKRRKK